MQKGTRLVSLLLLAAGGLVSMAACGGGSSSSGGGGGGGGSNPTPSGPVAVYPGTASVPVGQEAQFTAYLPSHPNSGFTWSVSGGSSNGTINSSGMFTAPISIPSQSQVTITAASTASSGLTGTAIITITATQGLAVSPTALAVPAGTTAQFTATSGGSAVTPTWEVNGAPGGNGNVGVIGTNGNYTAPLTPPPGGAVTITAVSGANSGTAAATIVFSDKSLTKDGSTGSYAFSYSGNDSTGEPLAVAGSFETDGNGNITAGLEDFDGGSNAAPITEPITGSYTVGPDGRATANIASGGVIWQFTLVSNQHALLIRFDTVGTGSGTIDLQNPTDFAASAILGNFAFSVSGIDSSGFPLTIAGRFNADGTIAITSGVEDVNDGGTSTYGDPDDTLLGTYQLDPVYGSSFGRGSITLENSLATYNTSFPGFPGEFTFAFYVVDNTHLKIVETDTTAILSGDIFSGPLVPGGGFGAAILKGKYAFTNGGADANGNPFAAAGVFNASPGTSSGATTGGITGVFDFNDGGTNIQLDQTLTGTYGVDTSSGRVSMPFTIPGRSAPLNYAAYVTSSGTVLMIELDTNPANNAGIAYLQTSTTPLQGSFALNLSGVATKTGTEQDISGQVATASNGTLTGSVDINNFQVNNIYQGLEILSGSTIGSADSNGRGTLTIETAQATFPLAYYIVDQKTVLLCETDSQRVLPGTLVKQF
jgi:hypothetical protein